MIIDELQHRILILDGATGTVLQQHGLTESDFRGEVFPNHEIPLKGNHDVLNLTRPDVIRQVHQSYIEAGADIIETNTFNANAISQAKYHCQEHVHAINLAGARLAREAADACRERQIFVAGSIGPTDKSLTLAVNPEEPAYRPIDFDTLADAYRIQVEALIEGGVDLLLVETVYDGLNAKAALYAIAQAQEKAGSHLPVMVSATVNDLSGRTLTGQTLEALYTSLSHYPLLSFGLNCSFGASELHRFAREISPRVPCYFSIYPNAGLPDEMGAYRESPEYTAKCIRAMAEEGLINIAGGCCGTTPAHIRAIAQALRGIAPRKPAAPTHRLQVSGLDAVVVDKTERNFTNIGERTNVAGSAKFARLIREKNYTEAATIARKQIEAGASIIDINMDDALLDSTAEMQHFIRIIENEPDIARAALMIDSSKWETLLAGLKNAQGKCIVNSISLKEGEEAFTSKAREIHRLGAAVVVMAFDEQGQATDYQRKIDICQRAYTLLTQEVGFAPEDIIFDVNILTIGTGIEAHANYAVDYIRAVEWIKKHLPGSRTSGGVSNLSFAFRGNNAIREALHSVFLYHAIRAGLDMAIVNPAQLQIYDNIEPELLQAAEDLVLNRCPEATEKLLLLAERYKTSAADTTNRENESWQTLPLDERLTRSLIKGVTEHLKDDISEALNTYPSPMSVIDGPLTRGMNRVGELFGEGKMFLPQVVKSARVMKEAVILLQPALEAHASANREDNRRPRIILATVKGDVHDIGKNIVHIVLACNNLEVIDLGVMVDNADIIRAAREHQADIIGVSGLITPSLGKMEELCRRLQEEQMNIPLIVGGATTSGVHTAVKLAPQYDAGVIAGGDASCTVHIIKRLLEDRENYILEIKEEQERTRELYARRQQKYISPEEARQRAPKYDWSQLPPSNFGEHNLLAKHLNIAEVIGRIDWTPFFHFWGFKGKYPELVYTNEEAEELHNNALAVLNEMILEDNVDISLVVRFFDAYAENDDIVLENGVRLPMPRQRLDQAECLSLADFIPSREIGTRAIGLFCLKVENKVAAKDARDYHHLLRESICARLAEATAEWMQEQVEEGTHVIRPAFGYPACPDHALKKVAFELLDAPAQIGVSLTENYSITPSTSLCGMLISHPSARYFSIGIE